MRVLALLATIVTAFVLTATPALAGGPTSVLIVSPTDQKVAARYNDQADYTRLSDLLDPSPVEDPKLTPMHGGPGSNAYNVTWLIHDVQVWRVDHVFLTADGGPVIETIQSYDGIKFDARGILHRAKDGASLSKLLYSMLQPPQAEPQKDAEPVRAAAVAQSPAPAPGIQWPSLVIGGIIGVALVFATRVVFGVLWRRRPTP